jgi:hemoglobin-like flavoprotein
VRPEDYSVVGDALLVMLRERIGPGWSAEAEAAWSRLYAGLAAQMIAAR